VLKPIARTAAWMREARHGHDQAGVLPKNEMLGPLAREARTLAQTLAIARASAQKEAELRIAAESSWTAERLAVCLHGKLKGSRLFVVANREPYMHTRKGRTLQTIVPASGLVTALEPVLRACDGTWVAHGSGNADREFVDKNDHVRVPPDDPRYTLRRLWLTEEEEAGYYYGFSNEGLWPLCHIAHTRPIFRSRDWEQYKKVNAKFADAVVQEMAGVEEPVVIVQDYHYALLPRMIKQRRPDARVGIFWHIPWPNAEAFGICPWEKEVLDGLLGADLIGFHVQYHCDNFLETVNRALESRIEWERFAVNRADHVTLVRPFPISVVVPEENKPETSYHGHQAAVLRELGSTALYVGVGVDRVDYTKGILERFQGIERFLEKYPQFQGKYTFIQIGAPSRTNIKRYDDFFHEVETEAIRVNRRFENANWRPIILRNHHHTHEEVARFYRAADMCLVTSLHDGMNLVAKEYLAARADEDGVLILSPFTGAARELHDALIVNPYDTDALADAIFRAIQMAPTEKQQRMRRMRELVKQQNVYRWAGCLISELCDVRVGMSRRKLASAVAAAGAANDEIVGEQFVDYFEDTSSVSSARDHLSA
jgi:trehalose 6-phosphate synthase